MSIVMILCGVSGSGKSTYAARAAKGGWEICSADHFFMKEGGKYDFNPSKLGEAHSSCFRRFIDLMSQYSYIIVDNTSTTALEVAPYYLAAKAFQFDVQISHIKASPAEAAARNIHSVPLHVVLAQDERIKDMLANLPPYWDIEVREE